MENLTGRQFYGFTVIEPSFLKRDYWKCKCKCGIYREVRGYDLWHGKSKSCGCDRVRHSITHGKCNSLEYDAWIYMKGICLNTRTKPYKTHGALGIKVCDRWIDSFQNFLDDMGVKRSKLHRLRRMDKTKDFTPDNCRWDTILGVRAPKS